MREEGENMNGNAEANYSLQNLKGKIAFIPGVDKTLTREGCAADAKETGKKIASIQFQVDNIDPHFAQNVGYDNANSGLVATNVKDALDEMSAEKSGYAFMHITSIVNGNTGNCTFDITPYANYRCIGMITINGSENVTSMAVVAWGKNYMNDLTHLVLGASSDMSISRSENVFTVNKTSGGIWGADMIIFKSPVTV